MGAPSPVRRRMKAIRASVSSDVFMPNTPSGLEFSSLSRSRKPEVSKRQQCVRLHITD